jgi:hypothetical protein
MSATNWFAASVILAGLSLAALPVPAQQQGGQQQSGDPVADAARRSREQKKTAPKPKKVYTDDDIKPAAPSSEAGTAAGAGSAQVSPDNGQGAVAADASKNDAETTWRKRFADQRAKIAAAEKELDILQREFAKAQLQYYNDPQKALVEQNTRKEINDKNAQIDQKKQDIANLKQQLSDLEDELRKSGGEPGWAR